MKTRTTLIALLTAALGLLAPAVASADLITDFAIFGVNNVFIPHGSNIAGWIGSNNTVNYIEGTNANGSATGTIKAVGKITLDQNITVTGDVLTNNTVTFGSPNTGSVSGEVKAGAATAIVLNGATVVGGVTTGAGNFLPSPLATLPALHVNPVGGANVDGGNVAPGSYGILENDGGANLTFTAGNYGFTHIFKDDSLASTWTMDVSGGDIWVYVSNFVSIQGGVTVNVIGGNASQVHWQTPGTFLIDGFVNFAGAIISTGNIHFDHHVNLTGTAWAGNNFSGGEAITQYNSTVTPVPEPATMLLLGTGLLGLGRMARRRQKP